MHKVGHLQPFYLCLSTLSCSLGGLQGVRPDKFCQALHPEDKNPAYIYRQDMELLMTESHTHLQDIKSSPSLTSQNNNFHEVEFVDKNNLELQSPRRDTSIPSVSAGLTMYSMAVCKDPHIYFFFGRPILDQFLYSSA